MSEMRKSKRPAKPARDVAPASGRKGTSRARSPRQLERQNKSYNLHLVGKSYDAIAVELAVDRKTVMRDVAAEGKLRAAELGDRRATEIARSVDLYTEVIRRAGERATIADEILEAIKGGSEARVNDQSLQVMINARERIDKVLGVEAAVKIDVGMQPLLEALNQ